jgi:hypothetical protein
MCSDTTVKHHQYSIGQADEFFKVGRNEKDTQAVIAGVA